MARNANQEMGLLYRQYKDETDKHYIVEICKNVFGGKDSLPDKMIVYAQADDCLPLIAERDTEVVAVCNLRLMESDDGTTDVIFIEGVRVSEVFRGKGIGTSFLREAMNAGESWRNSRSIRFLSTTIPSNLAMSKVFTNAGWACRFVVEMWPSIPVLRKAMQSNPSIRVRFMDSLQFSQHVPHHALASLSSWQKLVCSSQIANTLKRIHAHGGCLMKPGCYSVETARAAASMCLEGGQGDETSAWKLERRANPPILLFIQKPGAGSFESLPFGLVSACVVDIAAAESCVAFAASREDLDFFIVSFDPAITKDKINRSTLLSRFDTTQFLIYEAWR